MTDFEEYKEHIEYTFNAFCKIVIRHAAIDESRRLKSTWEHEISFEYLTEKKFYPFSTEDVYFAEPEERLEYPVFIYGQTIMLDNPPACRRPAPAAGTMAGYALPALL